ncbi:Hpt domain-containing protein [Planobispora siamensis]|uniref:HPt domain-containing protein n=1 Tax=Planobispora siamensis TaxID=936338 RepID=A0A8J3WLQ0_9ACTN|nr:Hpt domain-containing protein [Planobispora siamensis]GIH95539.1 hypothetical protein Psi01_61690 [Planobispora siamensis]
MTAPGTALSIRARLADLVEDGSPQEIEFIGRLVASFLERAPAMLAGLDAAVAAADHAATAQRAHALKGAAANLGVDSVAALCAEIEQLAGTAGTGGRSALLRSALTEAEAHFADVLDDLRSGLPIVPRPV